MDEDAHWADATSLELFDLTVERMRQLPVLALFTFRPEFEPPWTGLPNVGILALNRLDGDEVERIVTRVAGGRELPAEVTRQIVAKTDGNPLFVEELTKAVLEGGILVEDAEGYRLDEGWTGAIPATLQNSPMSRLDRLAPVKEISQVGAAIGREFSYSLLRVLVDRDEPALKFALAQLENAELVFRRGEPPEAVYIFKHALVRDAAYGVCSRAGGNNCTARSRAHSKRSLPMRSRASRKSWHTITRRPDSRPCHRLLAQGREFALSRSANAEAAKHLRQGIALTQSTVPMAERARKELDFYLALGPATAATEGYATPETLRVFSRARALLGDGGTPTEQMTVLWGVYLAHAMRGEYIAARDVAHQCLTLAAEHKHPGTLVLANRFMGQTLWSMGVFVDARVHLERTIELCAANQEVITSYRKFGADDQVTGLSSLSRTLWILGYPEQAVAASTQALARARNMGLAFTTVFALDGGALLGALGSDPQVAAAHANEAVAHSIEHNFADYEVRARFVQGVLLAQGGDPEHGIELMRNAIAAADSNSAQNRRTLYLGTIASAHASLGRPELGLNLLDEAIRTAEEKDERFFEAELHRLRGDMLLMLRREGKQRPNYCAR